MDTWGRVVPLSGNDVVRWRFGNKGRFTVNSIYKALTVNDAGLNHRKIWRGEIPAKIKIFLWLMSNDAILTKEGDPRCTFCDKY